MVLFLRSKLNRTIAEVEVYVKTDEENHLIKYIELHASVNIEEYSNLLLNNLKKEEIIRDFSDISELRGWLWESYFMGDENDPTKYNDVVKILKKMFVEIADKYELGYVED